MRGRIPVDQLLFDSEIEKTARANRRAARARRELFRSEEISESESDTERVAEMEQNGGNVNVAAAVPRRITLGDYDQVADLGNNSAIVRPPVQANNFELKCSLINMIQHDQFAGEEHEDPNAHIARFLALADTVKMNGVTEDAIKLRLFPFSLRDAASAWLNNSPPESIATWDELKAKFTEEFFPSSRFIQTIGDIRAFKQKMDEPFHTAWKRFKMLLRKCPTHGLSLLVQMQIFCNGLRPISRDKLDMSAGGTMDAKTPEEAVELVEAMASNDLKIHNDECSSRRAAVQISSMKEMVEQDELIAQNKVLTQQIEQLTKRFDKLAPSHKQVHALQTQPSHYPVLSCENCGGEHVTEQCATGSMEIAEVNYLANNFGRPHQGSQPYYNYHNARSGMKFYHNHGWLPDHNNFQRSSQNQPYQSLHTSSGQTAQNMVPYNAQQLQLPISAPLTLNSVDGRLSRMEESLAKFMEASLSGKQEQQLREKKTDSSIANLERQVGQIAQQMTEFTSNHFSGNTQVNPREHCKSIRTRSGLYYGEPSTRRIELDGDSEEEEKEKKEAEKKEIEKIDDDEVQKIEKESSPITDDRKIKKVVSKDEEKEEPERHSFIDPDSLFRKTKKQLLEMKAEDMKVPSYVKLPFPHLRQKDVIKQKEFEQFMNVFKKLQINIPFAEALEKIPSYAAFMKDFLSKKKKFQSNETVTLTEECSAILQRKLPPKLRDPGSFAIPCNIGGLDMGKALCDLGSSINLMPLSIWKKLGIGEMKPTDITLQLADRTLTQPFGIQEDVLVKVGKLIFPVDFIILDMEEDAFMPLIVGRPFLATGRAMFDIEKGELRLRAQDDEEIFHIGERGNQELKRKQCFTVEILEKHKFVEEDFSDAFTYNYEEPIDEEIEDISDAFTCLFGDIDEEEDHSSLLFYPLHSPPSEEEDYSESFCCLFDEEEPMEKQPRLSSEKPWFYNMAKFKEKGLFPKGMNAKRKKDFKKKAKNYVWEDSTLWHKGPEQDLRKCVPREDQLNLLKVGHHSSCGGHYDGRQTATNILHLGFYWNTIYKDAINFVFSCDRCIGVKNALKVDKGDKECGQKKEFVQDEKLEKGKMKSSLNFDPN